MNDDEDSFLDALRQAGVVVRFHSSEGDFHEFLSRFMQPIDNVPRGFVEEQPEPAPEPEPKRVNTIRSIRQERYGHYRPQRGPAVVQLLPWSEDELAFARANGDLPPLED